MKLKHNLLYKIYFKVYSSIAAVLLWIFSVAINKTLRIVEINNDEVDKVHKSGKIAILACWHQCSFPYFYYYKNYFKHRKICLLPINNLSGEILNKFLKMYKYETVRLPVDGHPLGRTESVLKILRKIKKGVDIALAVDGPPNEHIYRAKPGVLYLAQKTNNPLLPVGMYAKNYIKLLWRWDKYIIPMPFTKVVICFGKPMTIPKGTDVFKMKNSIVELEKKIFEATERAKKECLRKP